jgi:hypothetical protein
LNFELRYAVESSPAHLKVPRRLDRSIRGFLKNLGFPQCKGAK